MAWIAKAGAESGAYSLRDDSSFFSDCFSRLANCFDSLHGVSPEISAAAGSGDERRIEESANAAEKACRGLVGFCSCCSGVFAEQRICWERLLVNWVLNLLVLESFVKVAGMVSDMFAGREWSFTGRTLGCEAVFRF